MNRSLTAIFASLEAVLVIAVGIGISLAPLTVVWAIQYGFAVDWTVFWRASVDVWLVGHGTDLQIQLDPSVAASVGLPAATVAFPLTIAALGFALLTVLLGIRAGRRIGETHFRALGVIVSILVFAVGSCVVTLSAVSGVVRPSLLQGTFLPTVTFTLGLAIGVLRANSTQAAELRNSRPPGAMALPSVVRATLQQALTAGSAAVAGIVAIAAIAVATLMLVNFSQVVSLYEQVHGGPLGGLVLTLGQIAFLPNIVVWAASWFVGPGFAIGTGSVVGPLATSLGPIPAIPVLGALPHGQLSFGFVGLLVPAVVGFFASAVLRPSLVRGLADAPRGRFFIFAGLGTGVVAGIILALLAWWSGGAAGPGRLADVGPNPVAVGLCAALEIGLAATIGLFSARGGGGVGGAGGAQPAPR